MPVDLVKIREFREKHSGRDPRRTTLAFTNYHFPKIPPERGPKERGRYFRKALSKTLSLGHTHAERLLTLQQKSSSKSRGDYRIKPHIGIGLSRDVWPTYVNTGDGDGVALLDWIILQ